MSVLILLPPKQEVTFYDLPVCLFVRTSARLVTVNDVTNDITKKTTGTAAV